MVSASRMPAVSKPTPNIFSSPSTSSTLLLRRTPRRCQIENIPSFYSTASIQRVPTGASPYS